ncbi:phosphodiester glycosidase family protein [Streptomyces sp. NPDC088249]|uniref:phosphodiester glycosidase family protein n=1 Tax=Streptomyces sp. NPDC088249 TaxID=3365843 RepID=UPI00381FA373
MPRRATPRFTGSIAIPTALALSAVFLLGAATPGQLTQAEAAAAAGTEPVGRMPLGPDDVPTQTRPAEELAPGVTYRKYWQGEASDSWAVWVRHPEKGTETFGTRADADALAAAVTTAGSEARVDTFTVQESADTDSRIVGYGVRAGRFAADRRADAVQLQSALAAAGFGKSRVFFTAEDGGESKGPWQVRVITVAPSAQVALKAVHGTDVQNSETVRQLAKDSGALVAVNGSEFDIGGPNNPSFAGFEGVPQGLYMQGNTLLGAPNNGRTSLLLEGLGSRAAVDEVTSQTQVAAPDGSVRVVDGINRPAGQVLGCGGVGDDYRSTDRVRTLQPWRNTRCLDPNEIVVFRPEWGATTPTPMRWDQPWTDATTGWQAQWYANERDFAAHTVDVVMDGNWVVKELRSPAGGPIPAGGRVLQGIGAGADWLRAHSEVGKAYKPGSKVLGRDGKSVTTPTLSAVAGGTPALVRGGKVWLNPAANGMSQYSCVPADLGPGEKCRSNNTLLQRHARTLAGVTASGELLLVTIDGRDPTLSVGATLPEAAKVMKWLGATDAVGLGSGGDTTLIANDTLYNRPVDDWGGTLRERAVSNAVVIIKKP